ALGHQRVGRGLGGDLLLARGVEVAQAFDVHARRAARLPLDLQLHVRGHFDRMIVVLRAVVGIELHGDAGDLGVARSAARGGGRARRRGGAAGCSGGGGAGGAGRGRGRRGRSGGRGRGRSGGRGGSRGGRRRRGRGGGGRRRRGRRRRMRRRSGGGSAAWHACPP